MMQLCGFFVYEYFKQNDWLELYNTTDTELDAAGLYVSDDIDNPLKYQIQSGSVYNTKIPSTKDFSSSE